MASTYTTRAGGVAARSEAPMSEPALRQAITIAVQTPLVRYDRVPPASSLTEAETRVQKWEKKFRECQRAGNVLLVGISGATVGSPRTEGWESPVQSNPFHFPSNDRLWRRINLLAHGIPTPVVSTADPEASNSASTGHDLAQRKRTERSSKAHRRLQKLRDRRRQTKMKGRSFRGVEWSRKERNRAVAHDRDRWSDSGISTSYPSSAERDLAPDPSSTMTPETARATRRDGLYYRTSTRREWSVPLYRGFWDTRFRLFHFHHQRGQRRWSWCKRFSWDRRWIVW